MVRTLKDQNTIMDMILKQRLDDILPIAMKESNIDCWVVPSKEYNEDPMFKVLTPSGFPTARRISILVFFAKGDKVDRYCVNMSDERLEEFYTQKWTDKALTQWEALSAVIKEYNPKSIGLDMSEDYAYCDGLSVGLYNILMKELPKEVSDRFVSADQLGIRFLETRCDLEMKYYPEVMAEALKIIEEAFSSKVITPGVTKTSEVEDFMQQRCYDQGFEIWFHPDVNLQNEKSDNPMQTTVINKGDLLHCDFGIKYLGLCTDTQRLCYILKDDEKDIPEELLEAFKQNNRFQDIVRENFAIGKSGNDVFEDSLKQASKEGIKAMLYSHPLGINGHGAGPTIGLFSNQNRIPQKGDLLIPDHTGYALELNTRKVLAMYGNQEKFIFTEESVLYKDGVVQFLAPNRDKMYKL